MAPSQKKKNIAALHEAATKYGFENLLEISSKSECEVGRRLSAFSLKLNIDNQAVFLESAYQSSKKFRNGGPYKDILLLGPREAKKDSRLKNSGELVAFSFGGELYPLSPKNAFYDWIYIKALFPHRDWLRKHVNYSGFTDIEFNPERSINCQARAFAELMALEYRGILEQAETNFAYFSHQLPAI